MADPIDVFVSYKREERALAERVMTALQKAGYVAVADINIATSRDFADAIDQMIRAARLTLVLWTHASAGSEWVRREAQLAQALQREGKPNQYLGVMVEPLGTALRVDFYTSQMVDVSSGGLDDGGVDAVVAEVRAKLGDPRSASGAQAASQSDAAMDELKLFQLVRAMDTPSGYEHFLSVHPRGKFSDDARRDLARARAWYMHPFRRGSIGHTLTAAGVVVAVGFGLWGILQRDPAQGVAATVQARALDERDAARAAATAAEAEAARLAGQVGVLTAARDRAERELAAAKTADTAAKAETARLRGQVADLTAARDRAAKELQDARTAGTATTAEVARLRGQLDSLSKDREGLAKRLADAERAATTQAEAARVAKALAESRGLDLAKAQERLAALDAAPNPSPPKPDCTADGRPGHTVLGKCYRADSTTLDFKNTALVDLSALAGFSRLELLDLDNTKVSDLRPLAGLAKLRSLCLSGTPVDDLSPLTALSGLQLLYVDRTKVKDVSALRGLTRLRSLALSQAGGVDLEPLRNLKALDWLLLGGTPVRDLSPLAGLPVLNTLQTPDGKMHKGRPAVTAAIASWRKP